MDLTEIEAAHQTEYTVLCTHNCISMHSIDRPLSFHNFYFGKTMQGLELGNLQLIEELD
jgi:hypothetical protein